MNIPKGTSRKDVDPEWLRARNALIEQFVPLVTHVARILWNEKAVKRLGSFDDVVSVGYEGLIRAAERFDPTHPTHASFKTYAFKSVYRSIYRASDNAGVIRVPSSAVRSISKKRRKKANPDIIKCAIRALNCYQLPGAYDSPLDEDGEPKTKTDLELALEKLPAVHATAVCEMYGIGEHRELTIRNVCDRDDLSPHEVTELRRQAIEMLKIELEKLGANNPKI